MHSSLEVSKAERGDQVEKETIRIRYHEKRLEKLTCIEGKGDWIDLRCAEDVTLAKGEFRLVSLGISVMLPEGYEMIIAPRSSTYRNFGIIQANSLGIVDESYCGDGDIIRMPVIAMRDTQLHLNDRICQFRILRHQPSIIFEETEELGNPDRGGFGSTGRN
ncbi:MAG: deoxyuridine 5'-triphosphate nucleotidohydrolase [Blautia sp.]|nr:deoxyuridine 5'-triphosphate nucleotidohydrolase [Blautia sp.]